MCFGNVLDGLHVFLKKILRIPIISCSQYDIRGSMVGYYSVNSKAILLINLRVSEVVMNFSRGD